MQDLPTKPWNYSVRADPGTELLLLLKLLFMCDTSTDGTDLADCSSSAFHPSGTNVYKHMEDGSFKKALN